MQYSFSLNSSKSNIVEYQTIDASWSCVNGECGILDDDLGEYTTLEECELVCTPINSWDCVNSNCIELSHAAGTYFSIEACQSLCEQSDLTWNCIDNLCTSIDDGTGIFNSLEGCQQFCNSTSVVYLDKEQKKIRKIVDILGRKTNRTKNEFLFYIYDDGTVEKRIVIE